MEDSRIVSLFLDRDESAIEITAQKYGTQLLRIALNILEDPQTAEECVNDTYLSAWNAIPPHKPHSYFFPFLARIVRHIALDRCRERNRQKRGGLLESVTLEMAQCIPSGHSTEKIVDAKLLGAVISAFLRTLEEEPRNIFLRRYWYMDSVGDIANRFSISPSKVKTTLFRTRNQLRHYLKKEDYFV
jgi:RNA polymerase sigma-70 factor (ECF subfamily)